MDQIQINYFNEVLDELKIRSQFYSCMKVQGERWHGGKPMVYLSHATPVLAVISAFPFAEQGDIDVETFDLLNYKWILKCITNGWSSKFFQSFTANDVCNAIDVYYGIGKYHNFRWPNLDYHNIQTTMSVLDYLKNNNKKWDGEVTKENWKELHDLSTEAIRRREQQLEEYNKEHMKRRKDLFDVTISAASDSEENTSMNIDSSESEEVISAAAEQLENQRKEEEERNRKIELDRQLAWQYEEERKRVTDFNLLKQQKVDETKKEIKELRDKLHHYSKKVSNTNANNDLVSCKSAIESLCNVFIEIAQKTSWLEILKKRHYGESLEYVEEKEVKDDNTNDVKNEDEKKESVHRRWRRLHPNEISIRKRTGFNGFSATVNQTLSNHLLSNGVKFFSVYNIENKCYFEFFKTMPEGVCNCYYISSSNKDSVRLNSSQLIGFIFDHFKIESNMAYLKVNTIGEMLFEVVEINNF